MRYSMAKTVQFSRERHPQYLKWWFIIRKRQTVYQNKQGLKQNTLQINCYLTQSITRVSVIFLWYIFFFTIPRYYMHVLVNSFFPCTSKTFKEDFTVSFYWQGLATSSLQHVVVGTLVVGLEPGWNVIIRHH